MRQQIIKTCKNFTEEVEIESDCEISVKKPKIDTLMMRYTRRESLKELLAKCAAVDGFSFLQIVKSQAVREFISKRGYEMPNSDKTVKKMTLRVRFAKRVTT